MKSTDIYTKLTLNLFGTSTTTNKPFFVLPEVLEIY